MSLRFAACLVALVAVSGACGGRSITTETDNQTGGSSSHGGSPGSGANTSKGATTSIGATGSYGAGPSAYAGAAAGGYVGVGGTSPSTCACPPVACPPNFGPVPNGDGCCYHCESICYQTACPDIACGSGSHLEMVPGQCCPTCVQDDCDKQRAGYQEFKKQLLVEKYSSYGCKTSNDCTIYYEKNQCGVGCGIAVSRDAIDSLDRNLQSYAQQACSPNCPFLVPPCDAPAGSFCFNNRCQ